MKLKTLILALIAALPAGAQVKLLPIFTDNMVLQQRTQAPIWGEATAGKTVTVTTSWNKQSYKAVADTEGKWRVDVATPKAGGPYTVTISDGTPVVLKNVMIGEVWLCGGQSNMEMPLRGGPRWQVMNHDEEVANAAKHPNMRLLTIQKATSIAPRDEVIAEKGGWQVCSPEAAEHFSACGYFFGREIEKYQKVPVGLIMDCWGGTLAEAWTSGEALKEMPYFKDEVARLESLPVDDKEREALYAAEVDKWEIDSRKDEARVYPAASTWANPDADDSSWTEVEQPASLQGAEFKNFDGLFWERRKVEIPKSWEGKDVVLKLGNVDDIDQTYFNGVKVGAMTGYSKNREYTIPGKLVKKGLATIAVRILDTGGGAGIIGLNGKISMVCGNEEISLVGPWKVRCSSSLLQMKPIPATTINNPNLATVLYNAMLKPIIPYAIKGAIWYQGEANAGRAYQYRELLPLMIKDWRQQWGYTFPFYIAQLANFLTLQVDPVESTWAELREAQTLTQRMENVAMACLVDIGEADDIHPKNKQEVGRRLSLLARHLTYGEKLEHSGPQYKYYTLEGNKIRVLFNHVTGGLKTKDGGELKGFAIAGPDHKFHWAKATIDGNDIIVESPEVKTPVAVRYAWADNPICNVYNGEGLPMVPFRTDDWPGITYQEVLH